MLKKTHLALSLFASLIAFAFLPIGGGSALVNAQSVSTRATPVPQADRENLLAKELGISLAGNVLVFKTVEDYHRAVDNPSEEMSATVRDVIKKFSKFQSYLNSRRRAAEPAFNDEYFESMLNSDQVVQIGGHLFRVNPSSKKVFVLPASKINEYRDLVAENLSNKSISVYSTDEDVLDLVTGNASNQRPLICNEGGVGADAAQITFNLGNSQVQTLAAFNKYGIYFSLFAEVYPSIGSNQFVFEFNNGFGYIHWHARCGLTADYGTTSAGNNNGNAKQRYQSYQGSKNLANFFFGYRILLNLGCGGTTPLTDMNVIRKNW
jgi:hypothetical protein